MYAPPGVTFRKVDTIDRRIGGVWPASLNPKPELCSSWKVGAEMRKGTNK